MKLWKSYIIVAALLVGGYLGYKSPEIKPNEVLFAVLIGAFITLWIGVNILFVISPKGTISDFTKRGMESGSSIYLPISGMIVSLILFLIFRKLLNHPHIWKPIIIGVLVTGILAVVRIKSLKTSN
ncbi:MAG: hypothetical protein MUP70_16195 [Candidatus Aminicenantes bacterium]|nr:hypothetical protein [Candidatus Aminicenantes bacterium]